MADPFSILASGVGIADVAFRVIQYLKDVKKAAETVDEDIDHLISEVEALKIVHGQVEDELQRHLQIGSLSPRENILWFQTGKTLKEGQSLTKKLEECVKEIYGHDPKVKGKWDGLSKQHRKRSRDPRLATLRIQIHTHNNGLQIWLSIVSLYVAHDRHEDTTTLLEQVHTAAERLSSFQDFNNTSTSALERFSSSVVALEQSLAQAGTNKYFDTPQLVDRFYTGREEEADRLARYFFQSPLFEKQPLMQRRFVIYGVGGSGKTQFVCKFANDNRERFWGVFWIDGRSLQLLKQTLSQNVARIAGVDTNENAALHWLSNLEERWLLIIDNADDPAIGLDDYLPKGNRGHVLITTRNPTNNSYGNVGSGFFEFHGLSYDEASSLLLKAAGRSQPWDATLAKWASKISEALGFLALAIAVAGAAIREGFCQFHEYLDWYEEQRQSRSSRNRSRSPVRVVEEPDQSRSGMVEATFDISYSAIANRGSEDAEDALQLLKTFAFLHCENIRFAFLEAAVTNAAVESRQQAEDKKKEDQIKANSPPPTWSGWSYELLFKVLTYLYRNRSEPVLPDALRSGRKDGRFNRTRVRAAMRQLTQCSLVIYNHERDSYSMHPLVHKWARETPDMGVGEQGVWSEAAAVLLSSCILLPPLGATARQEELQRDLLPHVDHVRQLKASIEERIKDNRMARLKPWPVFEGGFNRERALLYAKFSIVYAQNSRWEDAKRLQTVVKDFTMKVLGLRHPSTRRIMLVLAGTLFWLGESDEAASLQEQVVNACKEYLGPESHDTLVAMQSLGESRFLQGRFTDARKLQEKALAGLQRLHGPDHEDSLNAMDYLGRTIAMFYTEEDFRQARTLHQTAIDGMRKLHGPEHTRTLLARENLCATVAREGKHEHLLEAHTTMNEVLGIRTSKLGRENGLTLLARVNLAVVKGELQDLAGAEDLMITGLRIAERNFGENYKPLLWARYHLGMIWVRQERWDEAEKLLVDVAERQRTTLQGRGRIHPDLVGTLVQLATVFNALEKYEKCDRVTDEALNALSAMSRDHHPVAQKLRADRDVWRERRVEERPRQSRRLAPDVDRRLHSSPTW